MIVSSNLPGHFAQAENFFIWIVTDGDLAHEGHQMMLAQRKHFNVFDHHQVLGVFLKYGVLYNS